MAFVVKRSDLIANNACESGIKFFDDISLGQNNGSEDWILDDWTPMHSVMLWAYCPAFFNFAEYTKIIPELQIPIKMKILGAGI